MSDSKDVWEDVLASVEAEIQRCAVVLTPDFTLAPAARTRDLRRSLSEPEPLVLPDPEDLPPVPPEIRARLRQLYDEIDRLAAAVRLAMQQMRTAQRLVPDPPTASVFVDRRV
jgi:hypothetical protein